MCSVARCVLFVVCCRLIVVCCLVGVVCCLLFVIRRVLLCDVCGWLLFAVVCALASLDVCCLLLRLLFVVRCVMFVVCGLLYMCVRCSLFVVCR